MTKQKINIKKINNQILLFNSLELCFEPTLVLSDSDLNIILFETDEERYTLEPQGSFIELRKIDKLTKSVSIVDRLYLGINYFNRIDEEELKTYKASIESFVNDNKFNMIPFFNSFEAVREYQSDIVNRVKNLLRNQININVKEMTNDTLFFCLDKDGNIYRLKIDAYYGRFYLYPKLNSDYSVKISFFEILNMKKYIIEHNLDKSLH